jgi:hypothetical protein
MNAIRQPNVTAMTGTINGVRIAPTFEPALKMPIASARSRCGNHSLAAASAAGNAPASPIASGMRAKIIMPALVNSACAT